MELPSKFDMSGRVALITGAAGLLGREHALALLEVGSKVVVTDLDGDPLNEAYNFLLTKYDPKSVIRMPMDVTNEVHIREVCNELTERSIPPDVLINNAAIDPKVTKARNMLEGSRLENFSVKDWDLQVNVGLKGAFLCSKIFGYRMAASELGGVILNIASDLSVFSPDQRLYETPGLEDEEQPVKPVTYSVIKTGLIGLTRYLATYWANSGVRCNALSPGGVENNQDHNFIAKLKELIPLNRMATKDEYRSAVQFLCSDASLYMNGQNVVMDGGRSVL